MKANTKLTILLFVFISLFFAGCNAAIIDEEGTEKNITKLVEQAYFEGQRDAINGDVRIKLNSEGVYFWTKSCWNSGITPIFNPTYLDSKNENSK